MINKHIDIVETIDLATSIVTFRTDGIFQVEIKNVFREIIEHIIYLIPKLNSAFISKLKIK
jgi:hypothetical protein